VREKIDHVAEDLKKKSGSRAGNYKKRTIHLLRILKKVRVASWRLQKMCEAVAEDFKKSAGRELKITKKVRIGC
jgi:hypothetical protein